MLRSLSFSPSGPDEGKITSGAKRFESFEWATRSRRERSAPPRFEEIAKKTIFLLFTNDVPNLSARSAPTALLYSCPCRFVFLQNFLWMGHKFKKFMAQTLVVGRI